MLLHVRECRERIRNPQMRSPNTYYGVSGLLFGLLEAKLSSALWRVRLKTEFATALHQICESQIIDLSWSCSSMPQHSTSRRLHQINEKLRVSRSRTKVHDRITGVPDTVDHHVAVFV